MSVAVLNQLNYSRDEETDSNYSDNSGGQIRRAVEFKFKCDFQGCNLNFKQKHLLLKHQHTVHSQEREKYTCTYEGCDKSYYRSYHLKRHVISAHEKVSDANKKKCKNKDRKYEKLFTCPNCNEVFRKKIRFKQHIAKSKCGKRTTVKTYSCEFCEKQFVKWSELVVHRRVTHPPTCETCGLQFKTRSYYRAHMQNHKKIEANEKFSCTYEGCNRTYFQKRNLTAHILSRHQGKKFPCTIEGCGKMLLSKRSLTKHIALHSKERTVVVRKPPAPRCDKGVQKLSTTSILSGISLKPELNKMILQGKSSQISIDCDSFSDVTETDGEDGHIPKKVEITVKKDVL